MNQEQLLAELEIAAGENFHDRPCQACVALQQVTGQTHSALEAALGGTIGVEKLAAILTRNGYRVGRRAITAHRREGHLQP